MTTLTPARRNAVTLAAAGLHDALLIHHVRPTLRDRIDRIQAWGLDYAESSAGQSLVHVDKAADELVTLLAWFDDLTYVERWLGCRGLRVADTVRGEL